MRGNGEEAGEAAGASGLDADLSQVKGRREGRRQAEQAHFELQSGFKEVWQRPMGSPIAQMPVRRCRLSWEWICSTFWPCPPLTSECWSGKGASFSVLVLLPFTLQVKSQPFVSSC